MMEGNGFALARNCWPIYFKTIREFCTKYSDLHFNLLFAVIVLPYCVNLWKTSG